MDNKEVDLIFNQRIINLFKIFKIKKEVNHINQFQIKMGLKFKKL